MSQPMRLLMLLLGNWSLCRKVSDEQLAMFDEIAGYAPVAELIRFARANDQSTVASFQEAMRGSPHAAIFEEAASKTLMDVMDVDAAETDVEAIFRSLEDSKVRVEFEQLTSKLNKTEEEKARWRQLNRKIAESRGAPVSEPQHEN